MTPDRQALVNLLIRHEGLRLTVYTDSVGVPTIGVGRNLRDAGISSDEAMVLLNHDLDAVIQDLSSFDWFVGLNPIRQQAVVDLRFNLGATGFREFRNFIHDMAIGNFPGAAQELLSSRAATDAPTRYHELADMIRTGTD